MIELVQLLVVEELTCDSSSIQQQIDNTTVLFSAARNHNRTHDRVRREFWETFAQ